MIYHNCPSDWHLLLCLTVEHKCPPCCVLQPSEGECDPRTTTREWWCYMLQYMTWMYLYTTVWLTHKFDNDLHNYPFPWNHYYDKVILWSQCTRRTPNKLYYHMYRNVLIIFILGALCKLLCIILTLQRHKHTLIHHSTLHTQANWECV